MAASGLRLESSQSGIVLRIKRDPGAKDLKAFICTVSNSKVDIMGGELSGIDR